MSASETVTISKATAVVLAELASSLSWWPAGVPDALAELTVALEVGAGAGNVLGWAPYQRSVRLWVADDQAATGRAAEQITIVEDALKRSTAMVGFDLSDHRALIGLFIGCSAVGLLAAEDCARGNIAHREHETVTSLTRLVGMGASRFAPAEVRL